MDGLGRLAMFHLCAMQWKTAAIMEPPKIWTARTDACASAKVTGLERTAVFHLLVVRARNALATGKPVTKTELTAVCANAMARTH